MNIVKKLSALVLVLGLSACASSEVSKPVEFFGGSKAGGFDAQTGCGAVLNGAGCAIATRDASGNIMLQQVALKDSVQGNVVQNVTSIGVSKGADWAIARDLQRNAPDCGTNCNHGGGNQLVNVAVQTSSEANANAEQRSAPALGPCGQVNCPTLKKLD